MHLEIAEQQIRRYADNRCTVNCNHGPHFCPPTYCRGTPAPKTSSEAPIDAPSGSPLDAPTAAPTYTSSEAPTDASSGSPLDAPTAAPTYAPSKPLRHQFQVMNHLRHVHQVSRITNQSVAPAMHCVLVTIQRRTASIGSPHPSAMGLTLHADVSRTTNQKHLQSNLMAPRQHQAEHQANRHLFDHLIHHLIHQPMHQVKRRPRHRPRHQP